MIHTVYKKNNVLHLLESPKQVLACWHVTFVPKRKGALSPQAMRTRSPTKVDDDDDNAHSRVAEWQRRVNQRDMNLRSPRLHHSSSSSPTHRGKHHYEMSKNAPEERKSATLAYHRLEVEIDFIRKGLQQNLSDLHDRVKKIHENYIRVEDEITKNLEHSLKDLLYKANRRYKLHAWKLQLKEYLCHANLIDRLHSTAGKLQYEQKKLLIPFSKI